MSSQGSQGAGAQNGQGVEELGRRNVGGRSHQGLLIECDSYCLPGAKGKHFVTRVYPSCLQRWPHRLGASLNTWLAHGWRRLNGLLLTQGVPKYQKSLGTGNKIWLSQEHEYN